VVVAELKSRYGNAMKHRPDRRRRQSIGLVRSLIIYCTLVRRVHAMRYGTLGFAGRCDVDCAGRRAGMI
jgi:hypothetical protein